jgi:drug/metabolite transporter superfamily protein YnfA
MNIFKRIRSKFSIAGEFLNFLWKRKLWWLIPMMVILLSFGLLMIFVEATGIAPFIYTLF